MYTSLLWLSNKPIDSNKAEVAIIPKLAMGKQNLGGSLYPFKSTTLSLKTYYNSTDTESWQELLLLGQCRKITLLTSSMYAVKVGNDKGEDFVSLAYSSANIYMRQYLTPHGIYEAVQVYEFLGQQEEDLQLRHDTFLILSPQETIDLGYKTVRWKRVGRGYLERFVSTQTAPRLSPHVRRLRVRGNLSLMKQYASNLLGYSRTLTVDQYSCCERTY